MPLVVFQTDPRARLKPCVRCGYSLRSIADARNCPECGLAIWITLSGNDELEMSNPSWLNRLALGSITLAATHALLWAGVVVMHARQLFSERGWLVSGHLGLPYGGAAYFALCGVALIVLTGDEGRIPEPARGLRRAGLIVGWMTLVLGLAIVAPTSAFRVPVFVVLLIAHAQAIVAWMYLSRLARRIPSRRDQTLARYLALAVAICLASLIFRGTDYAMLALVMPWSKLVIAWTLFLLVYPAAAAALFASFARTFYSASQAARKNWETGAADAPLASAP